jgi:hypothetical protein
MNKWQNCKNKCWRNRENYIFYNLALGSKSRDADLDPHGSAYYFEKPAPDTSEKPHQSQNSAAVFVYRG